MDLIKRKLWPVLAGLLTAFLVMMIFEFVNSYFFPLPEGLDMTDTEAVHAFTATLPWTAYILVLLGWIVGAFKAGCVATYLSKEYAYRLSFITGIILTLLGLVNNLAIGSPILFNVISLPMFIIFTYLGHKYLRKMHAGRQENQ